MRENVQSRMDAALEKSRLWRRQRASSFHGAQVTPSGMRAHFFILFYHKAMKNVHAVVVGPETQPAVVQRQQRTVH